MTPPLWQKVKRKKSILMKVKEEWKSWFKAQHSENKDHDIWSHQFSSVVQLCLTLCDPMDCSMPGLPVHHQLPEFTQTHVHQVGDAITSWQIDGETMETVTDSLFMGSKITADGECSHEIKRHLFLGRKIMTNLDSILKSRDITLRTKVRLVKAMVFPVVMYGCESWTLKKTERQRIDAFELWCWRRLLRVPWTARRSNQSILKQISPEYSLEGLMLKLKLQYFGCLMRRTVSLEKTLMLRKIEGRRRGWQRMRWLDGIIDSMGMSLSKLWEENEGQGSLACCSPWGRKESDTTEWLIWTD